MAVLTYEIKKNVASKKIEISVGSQMTQVEAERFQKEFIALVQSITPSQFDLEIDSTHMSVLTPDLAAHLEGTMRFYKEAGFKKVIIKMQNNPVLKMQAGRVARQAGLTNLEIIH